MALGKDCLTNRHGSFSSFAVSGQCSSGKSTLCRVLSRKLNWPHVDIGNEFRRAARSKGLEIEKFGSVSDKLLREIDDKMLVRIQSEEKMIWDGRLACYLARSSSKVFKVYCVADLDVRATRCGKRDRLAFEEARRRVLTRDNEEANVFRRLYGFSNPFDISWVNLKLDTSSKSSEELACTVVESLDKTHIKEGKYLS